MRVSSWRTGSASSPSPSSTAAAGDVLPPCVWGLSGQACEQGRQVGPLHHHTENSKQQQQQLPRQDEGIVRDGRGVEGVEGVGSGKSEEGGAYE